MFAGSLWQDYFLPPSAIDTLLKKSDVTLQELLDEDEVMQECKHANQDLIEFLSRPTVVREMLNYIIKPFDPNGDEKEFRKFPYVCAELFSCDCEPVLEVITTNQENMNTLFSLLDRPTPLDSAVASAWAKVIFALLRIQPLRTIQYIKSNQIVRKLVSHCNVHAMIELLSSMWGDHPERPLSVQDDRWLVEENLIDLLIDKLGANYESNDELQKNVAQAILNLIEVYSAIAARNYSESDGKTPYRESQLIQQLECESTVRKICQQAFDEQKNIETHRSTVLNSLLVLTAIVDRHNPHRKHKSLANQNNNNHTPMPMPSPTDHLPKVPDKLKFGQEDDYGQDDNIQSNLNDDVAVAQIVTLKKEIETPIDAQFAGVPVLIQYIPHLNRILLSSQNEIEYRNQFGSIRPLGELRLRAVHLARAIVQLSIVEIEHVLCEHHVLPHLLDLFFTYAWNNLLHEAVTSTVLSVLHSSSSLLKKSLFEDGKLTERIVEASHKSKEEAAKWKNVGLGYMAHIVEISNSLEKLSQDIYISTFIQQPSWTNYTQHILTPINQDINTTCGGEAPSRDAATASLAFASVFSGDNSAQAAAFSSFEHDDEEENEQGIKTNPFENDHVDPFSIQHHNNNDDDDDDDDNNARHHVDDHIEFTNHPQHAFHFDGDQPNHDTRDPFDDDPFANDHNDDPFTSIAARTDQDGQDHGAESNKQASQSSNDVSVPTTVPAIVPTAVASTITHNNTNTNTLSTSPPFADTDATFDAFFDDDTNVTSK